MDNEFDNLGAWDEFPECLNYQLFAATKRARMTASALRAGRLSNDTKRFNLWLPVSDCSSAGNRSQRAWGATSIARG